MTDDQLVEYERLANAATAHPWIGDFGDPEYPQIDTPAGQLTCGLHGGNSCIASLADAQFIISARTAVPALCAEVRRLSEVIGILEDDVHELSQMLNKSASATAGIHITDLTADQTDTDRVVVGQKDKP